MSNKNKLIENNIKKIILEVLKEEKNLKKPLSQNDVLTMKCISDKFKINPVTLPVECPNPTTGFCKSNCNPTRCFMLLVQKVGLSKHNEVTECYKTNNSQIPKNY